MKNAAILNKMMKTEKHQAITIILDFERQRGILNDEFNRICDLWSSGIDVLNELLGRYIECVESELYQGLKDV